MESVKVIIVGGGVAGLGAAKALGSSVDYLLIEAQDYLGGRIRTVDAGSDVFVDLGAQYIHGKTTNIVYEICRQLNCILSDNDNESNNKLVITSNQFKIDSELMNNAINIWEAILYDAQSKFGDLTMPVNYSLAEYLNDNLKQRLSDKLLTSDDLINAFIQYFNQTELIENGCSDLSNLSLTEYGSFEYLDGFLEYKLKNGGYRPLISYLKSFIPNDNRIRLNSEVIKVEFNKETHKLLVHIKRNDRNAPACMINIIECDHMIWTSSLGYLKENFSSIFSNEHELLRQKQNAIDNIGYDTVNKVILVYEEQFWPKDISDIILLKTDKKIVIELSDELKNLLKEENIDMDSVKIIIDTIHRYEIIPSANIPILICWFGGPAAVLLEKFDNRIIGEICHEILSYYMKISSKLYKLKCVLKSEWHNNRFIRGSYSYYSIKSSMKDGEELRAAYKPDRISRIQFAGEATHEKFYSTVHGALESGIREGNFLLKMINT